MADLNALIAQGAQFNMPDQLGQYAKMQQLQAGQQQMQLGQQQMRTSALQEQNATMQLQKLQQDRDNIAKLSQMLAKDGITPRQYFQAFQQSNDPQHQKLGIEGLMTLDATEAFNRSQQTIPAGQAPAPMAGGLGTGTFGIDNIPGMPNALASRAAPMASTNAIAPAPAAADPVAAIEAEMRRIQPFVLSGATGAKEAMARLEKRLELASKRYTVNNTLMNQMGDVLGTAPAAPVLPFTPDVEAQRIRIANASRAPAAPRAEQPPVAVVDPATGKQVYVTREQALSGKMTPASAMEGLTPKEKQNREAKYPQAKQATTTVSATMNEIDATIQRLLANEKGLNGITGLVYGNTMALTDAARKAQADLKQLKNLAFVQGLTELRNASSTGAGVGNVSNKEGDRFENLKASLEQSQSTQDLKDSLTRLRSQANATNETIKQAFEDTYSYRNNVAAPSATPAAGGLNVVVTPDGQSHTFPTPAAAAQFKKAAGI